MPGGEPAAATLRRIAYLLEEQRAETYRVRAFRRAAMTVDSTDPEHLRHLMESGRLADLPSVGPTTAAVISDVLQGKVPPYLESLELGRPEPSSDVETMLRRLRGDLHSHSDWSDGGASIFEMAAAAPERGHEYLALTDHSPRLAIAHGLDTDRLKRQLEVVADVNDQLAPFRMLTGIEVDILEDGSLDQDEELLAVLDVVVASVHSKLRQDSVAMTERMVAAIENPHADVLGHCTGRIIVGRGRPPSSFDPDAVFSACARTRTAVEINSRPERLDPPTELLRQAVEAGCLLAIDTDAHAPGQLEWQHFGCRQALDAGVTPERIVNRWPVERLLEWTRCGHS